MERDEHDDHEGVAPELAARGPDNLAQLVEDLADEQRARDTRRWGAAPLLALGGLGESGLTSATRSCGASSRQRLSVRAVEATTAKAAVFSCSRGRTTRATQGRRQPNPQPPVLDTGALPIQPHRPTGAPGREGSSARRDRTPRWACRGLVITDGKHTGTSRPWAMRDARRHRPSVTTGGGHPDPGRAGDAIDLPRRALRRGARRATSRTSARPTGGAAGAGAEARPDAGKPASRSSTSATGRPPPDGSGCRRGRRAHASAPKSGASAASCSPEPLWVDPQPVGGRWSRSDERTVRRAGAAPRHGAFELLRLEVASRKTTPSPGAVGDHRRSSTMLGEIDETFEIGVTVECSRTGLDRRRCRGPR